ncbi:MAG: TRZ/ATZ family hydrolase [Zoogloeaceae bacterium]|jgi:5-methylthioadenosine/S-adenosylhomocysteine deaminase|nr:TRZ/ATZ family hydrolase [Zoogloeaceae bacterium]
MSRKPHVASIAPESARHPDLVIHARYLAQVENDNLLEHYSVVVQRGRILDILPSALAREYYQAKECVELDEHLLFPGLINLHTHAAMSLLRGVADDLPMMRWLKERIWPLESALVSHEFTHDGTRLACAEMLKGGVTTFNDMYFFPDAAATAAVEAGMRAILGITVLEFSGNYASDAADYLHKGVESFERWHAHPLIGFCLAPHAPYSVSDTTFERIQTLAAQLALPIHTHLHENHDEIREHLETYGCRPLYRLKRLGVLGPQFIGVHATHLLPDEIETLAEYGCNLVHCPASNLKLGCGIAPLADVRRAGIHVGLGTDSAASNNRLDILAETRLASLLAKGVNQDAGLCAAWEMLRMATLEAAIILGREESLGSITVGKWADMAAIRLDTLSLLPCYHPVSHLVYGAGREDVSHVWVGGEARVFDKVPLNIDVTHLKNIARLWQNRVVSCLKMDVRL